MAEWILIFVVTVSAGFGGGSATTSVYFKSNTACEAVLKDVRNEAKRTGSGFWGGCYPDR